jgi:TPR repeat protein
MEKTKPKAPQMSNQNKINQVKQMVQGYKEECQGVSEDAYQRLADFLFNNKFAEPETALEYVVQGQIYKQKGDFDKMFACYNEAIELNSPNAMNNLAFYYESKGDTQNMLKYYEMAADHGNLTAICNLGHYYKGCNDTENMVKYHKMGAENGSESCCHELGIHYMDEFIISNDGKDYEQMMKWFKGALDKKYTPSMFNLGDFHAALKMETEAKKYYAMAAKYSVGPSKSLADQKVQRCQLWFASNFKQKFKPY